MVSISRAASTSFGCRPAPPSFPCSSLSTLHGVFGGAPRLTRSLPPFCFQLPPRRFCLLPDPNRGFSSRSRAGSEAGVVLDLKGWFNSHASHFQINHIDNERANNCIENLQPMHSKEHQRMTNHQKGPDATAAVLPSPSHCWAASLAVETHGPSSRARVLLQGKRGAGRPAHHKS